LDTDALKTFCSAARLRSISKAADSLGLNQTTATMHIKRLELEVGAPLFDRKHRPIELTPAGRIVYQRTFPLVEALKGMMEDVGSVSRTETITIACSTEIAISKLPGVMVSFHNTNPDVRLVIKSRISNEVPSAVRAGTVDIGVATNPDPHPDLIIERLCSYPRILIAPAGHPILDVKNIGWEDVARWPLVLSRPGTSTRELVESEFQRLGLSYDIVVELDSFEATKKYVALGAGISFAPRTTIGPEDRDRIATREFDWMTPKLHIAMMTLKGKHGGTALQGLQDELRAQLNDDEE